MSLAYQDDLKMGSQGCVLYGFIEACGWLLGEEGWHACLNAHLLVCEQAAETVSLRFPLWVLGEYGCDE